MKLSDIDFGDVLVSTDCNGTGFYRVEKVCRKVVKVATEQGHIIRAYPIMFDSKLTPAKVAELRAERAIRV